MQNKQDEPIITKVPKSIIKRPEWTPFNIPYRYRPKKINLNVTNTPLAETAQTWWDKTKFYAKLTLLAIKLTPLLIQVKVSVMMKDWKTTIAGIVKVIFMALTLFGVHTGNLTESIVTGALYALAEIVQAIYTPDNK